MSEITLSNEEMQYITMASKYTQANILDCVEAEDRLVFVVEKGQLGVAIGSNAKKLERLRKLFKKNIRFVEFDKDKERFIHNLFKPYSVKEVVMDGNVARVKVKSKDKSRSIGRGGKNIELIRRLAQRHHSIKDVQIM